MAEEGEASLVVLTPLTTAEFGKFMDGGKRVGTEGDESARHDGGGYLIL